MYMLSPWPVGLAMMSLALHLSCVTSLHFIEI